jgi:hypothetical protein
MAVMAMVHVPSLAMTKSSAMYHHQLGKRTTHISKWWINKDLELEDGNEEACGRDVVV